jgi:hypothetical protein
MTSGDDGGTDGDLFADGSDEVTCTPAPKRKNQTKRKIQQTYTYWAQVKPRRALALFGSPGHAGGGSGSAVPKGCKGSPSLLADLLG